MTGRPLALVVEDAPDQATLLGRYLDREGFDVFVAPDAESAIAAFPDIDPRSPSWTCCSPASPVRRAAG